MNDEKITYYGIYRITNLLDGKMYIGQHITSNLDDGYMGSGLLIKKAIKKYGVQNFRKEWLMFCEDEEELNYMERVYVDQTWVDRSDTYNLVLGGEVHPLRDEIRNKISRKCMGRKHTEEWKKKHSHDISGEKNWLYGKHLSEETKRKLSEARQGKCCGERYT